ncbi:MAG: tail fiber protein [Pseudomonadota bacterium]
MTIRIASLAIALGAVLGLGALTPAPADEPDYYIGQIFLGGWNFCPRNSIPTNGQLLQVSQFTALFSLLGTTYGGDGRTTFGIPNLQARTPIGEGRGPGLPPYSQGQAGGAEQVALVTDQLPAHSHDTDLQLSGRALGSSATASATDPTGNLPAVTIDPSYAPAIGAPMAANSVTLTLENLPTSAAGDNQSFGIRDPYLGLTYCIALEGIYPSRS